MKQKTYVVNDKEYSRERLIEIGRGENSGAYWVARILGVIFFFVGLFFVFLIAITMIILFATGVFSNPEFPIWVFYIPLGVFGSFFIMGLIMFIVSFTNNTEERYIKSALIYLEKHKDTSTMPNKDEEALKRYERLYKGGVISKEEYDTKTKEINDRTH